MYTSWSYMSLSIISVIILSSACLIFSVVIRLCHKLSELVVYQSDMTICLNSSFMVDYMVTLSKFCTIALIEVAAEHAIIISSLKLGSARRSGYYCVAVAILRLSNLSWDNSSFSHSPNPGSAFLLLLVFFFFIFNVYV